MPEDIIDNTSIYVQAMAWCQGTWANIVHDLFRQTASLGHYGLTSEVVKLRSNMHHVCYTLQRSESWHST